MLFQKEILMINYLSFKGLFNEPNSHFDINYLITRRLNKDVLENFFRFIRFMTDYHPDPLNFKYR